MLFFGNQGNINTHNSYNIAFNRDFQATELFLKNHKTQNYNSFIFGNSRASFYKVKDWKKHIHGNCFHFNSNLESLFGIERKIAFLDKKEVHIKNALIVLDASLLKKIDNSKGHLFIKHPAISGESVLDFYTEMFYGYFPEPIYAYMHLFLTGKRKNYMSAYGITDNIWKIDLVTNELNYFKYDSILSKNSDSYYKSRKKLFKTRTSIQQYSPATIGAKQKELLTHIKRTLNSHQTNCKIVISPLYNQLKINNKDVNYLNELFGAENVFDFSGINELTSDYKNYYETSHYRPHIAKEILLLVYAKP